MSKTKEIAVFGKNNIELPVRKGPLHFCVTWMNGLITSNTWGVKTEKTGDAYIYCRDNMQEIKISLHKSGKQHIAFTESSGHQMTPDNRFWNQWREPPQQTPLVPSFKLFFPRWGIGLNGEDRNKTRSKWDKNQILIEGDDKLLTVVSFYILDQGLLTRHPLPRVVLSALPLKLGKDLYVIVSREQEQKLKSRVEEGLRKITIPAESVPEKFRDDVLSVCLTGDQSEGYAYMVVVPVKIMSDIKGN